MNSIEYASNGMKLRHLMLKKLTIIEYCINGS